jgi:hypothetical protein
VRHAYRGGQSADFPGSQASSRGEHRLPSAANKLHSSVAEDAEFKPTPCLVLTLLYFLWPCLLYALLNLPDARPSILEMRMNPSTAIVDISLVHSCRFLCVPMHLELERDARPNVTGLDVGASYATIIWIDNAHQAARTA